MITIYTSVQVLQIFPTYSLCGVSLASARVTSGVSVGVAKGIKGNYDARRAYGLSCSPRQAAMAQAPTVGDRLETD